MPASTLDQLLASVADPSAPLITHYTIATGERVELSSTTTANWVNKTSNFFVDELDAGIGTTVRIGMPSHWLKYVCLLAAWSVGATVTDRRADIAITGPDLNADEPIRVAASLRPLGARFTTPPEGFIDLNAEVPGHGDHFIAMDPPAPDTDALDLDDVASTHAEFLACTPPNASRLLVEPDSTPADASRLVAALKGGGSLVLVTAATPSDITRISGQERAKVA